VSRSIAAAAAAASASDSVQAATQLIINSQTARRQQQAQLSKHTTAILEQSGTVTADDASTPLPWCSSTTSEHSSGLPLSHPAVQLHQVCV
jgi:riboflavin biosynthesis pyrimidine reductase